MRKLKKLDFSFLIAFELILIYFTFSKLLAQGTVDDHRFQPKINVRLFSRNLRDIEMPNDFFQCNESKDNFTSVLFPGGYFKPDACFNSTRNESIAILVPYR